MRPTKGADSRKPFVQKVVVSLHRTVIDKIVVRMDRRGLAEAEAAGAVTRLRCWSPKTMSAAEGRHPQER